MKAAGVVVVCVAAVLAVLAGQATGAGLDGILEEHNKFRCMHGVPALKWNATVASVAQAWAQKLGSQGCGLTHSSNGYGENLAMGTRLDGIGSADMWYNEVKSYNFNNPGFSGKTGHFTQVVWKGSTDLGCGIASCSQANVVVCNYYPPGNYDGEYTRNVFPQTKTQDQCSTQASPSPSASPISRPSSSPTPSPSPAKNAQPATNLVCKKTSTGAFTLSFVQDTTAVYHWVTASNSWYYAPTYCSGSSCQVTSSSAAPDGGAYVWSWNAQGGSWSSWVYCT